MGRKAIEEDMRDRRKTLLTALFVGAIAAIVVWQSKSHVPLPEACEEAREQLKQLATNDGGLASIVASIPEGALDSAADERVAGQSSEQCTAILSQTNAGLEALSHEAWGAKMMQAGSQTRTAMRECREKREKGELKTHVESVQCSNTVLSSAYQNAGYPYMDLVARIAAKRLALAEGLDKSVMSSTENPVEFGRLSLDIAEEERQRNTQKK
jgi:hypothetical protein